MFPRIFRIFSAGIAAAALIIGGFYLFDRSASAQESEAVGKSQPICKVDLSHTPTMKDIISNALMRGLNHPEKKVQAFLKNAGSRFATGQDLLKAAALHFEINETALGAEVEKYRHCNCSHPPLVKGQITSRSDSDADGDDGSSPDSDRKLEVTTFARDVVLHVVLHELGHALIREFDLPVLGNEETIADAFATHYLTTHLPERAVDVLKARVASLMVEAREVPRKDWPVSGEHNSDARRAYQIASLAIAADHKKYRPVAEIVGMTDNQIRKSRDYGSEIHRSWRRVLKPLWMPKGLQSTEARLSYDSKNAFLNQLCSDGLADLLRSTVKRFDWHSQVTIRFVEGDGGAGWSRSKRSVTVHGGYVERFIKQGKTLKP